MSMQNQQENIEALEKLGGRVVSAVIEVSLANTKVTDKGLVYLKEMTHLKELDLSGTEVTDEGLRGLAGLTNLKVLNLRLTNVTKDGVTKLRSLLPECQIFEEYHPVHVTLVSQDFVPMAKLPENSCQQEGNREETNILSKLSLGAYSFEYAPGIYSPKDGIDGVISFNTATKDGSKEAVADHALKFKITEGTPSSYSADVPEDALQVTVALDEKSPAEMGFPSIEIEGYTCRLIDEDKMLRRFVFADAKGDILTLSAGRKIPQRKFVVPNIDIMKSWSADTEVRFPSGGATVAFSNPLLLTLVSDERVNIATLPTGGEPSKQTLERHLSLLNQGLLADAITDGWLLKIDVSCDYALGDPAQGTRVKIPLLSLPPTAWSNQLFVELASALESQIAEKSLRDVGGGPEFLFELTALHSESRVPVLRLGELFLPLAEVKKQGE